MPIVSKSGIELDSRVSVLLLADSLAFHGPRDTHSPTHPQLYPQVCAQQLGTTVDLLARQGWTARDAWWALTKDPMGFGVYLPRAEYLVIGVGGMDHLPAALPTWLRESIPYIRPGSVRRLVRRTYRRWSPAVIRGTGGRVRQLPQAATERYWERIVTAARHWRPGIPIAMVGPSAYAAPSYPATHHHVPAVRAAARWCAKFDVAFVDVDPFVLPTLHDGSGNPDGLHWAWSVHEAVGGALADALRARANR
jgi:hypothetical protein